MATNVHDNRSYELANDFLIHTSYPVFLTGKAGTGKTTFLKNLRTNLNKNMVVVAPTGVAAINAGGVTIHSFFQLPFGPFIPTGTKKFDGNAKETNDKHSLLAKLRLSTDRQKVMQELELLVVDEISMVRCDVLDAMDLILRHVRRKYTKPFGGVQVLYIGDLYQLPPVIKDDEWAMLKDIYETQFFFSSLAYKEQPAAYIELKKVYRQSDSNFIGLLNKVRNNEMDEEAAEMLNKQEKDVEKFVKETEAIILTSHNAIADGINNQELEKLDKPFRRFSATITGEFFESAYPAEEILQLKEGAHVMFIKNDVGAFRKFFNGKIGVVDSFSDEHIVVRCTDGPVEELIEVKREKWDNIRYSVKPNSSEVNEDVVGTFEQYPLRLAWAITIHKSQGLTFDNVVIDAAKAFAPGQVYVALSRARTLDGICLKSRINYFSLGSNQQIVRFSADQRSLSHQEDLFIKASAAHLMDLVFELFDYEKDWRAAQHIEKTLLENSLAAKYQNWLQPFVDKLKALESVGAKFAHWMRANTAEQEFISENEAVKTRLVGACKWFYDEQGFVLDTLTTCPIVTDNKAIGTELTKDVKDIFARLHYKQHFFEKLQNGFDEETLRASRRAYAPGHIKYNALSNKSSFISDKIKYPTLFVGLRALRDEICAEEELPVYMVCSVESLEEMTNKLPMNAEELKKIKGFGQTRAKKYGSRFLELIVQYIEENNVERAVFDESTTKKIRKPREPRPDKVDTKKVSYDLYNAGKSIAEIAKERNFAESTILGHLSHFVETGLLGVEKFVAKETVEAVLPHITDDVKFADLLQYDNSMGYGEIRMIMAHHRFLMSKTEGV